MMLAARQATPALPLSSPGADATRQALAEWLEELIEADVTHRLARWFTQPRAPLDAALTEHLGRGTG